MKKLILLLITATQLAGVTVAWETNTLFHDEHSIVPVVNSLAGSTRSNFQDEPNSNEQLYANEQISVSSIFPNPASAFAYVDYRFNTEPGDLREAKIVLCNVLGNVVGEYRLSREAKRLNIATQELTSGVYFYTLALNGRNVVTRKLIIRHSS